MRRSHAARAWASPVRLRPDGCSEEHESAMSLARYADTSFWLEDARDALTPRASLQRSEEVDVAILGAGYTGLWTAHYLLRTNPGLKVAVIEREIAGYG